MAPANPTTDSRASPAWRFLTSVGGAVDLTVAEELGTTSKVATVNAAFGP
jgi:hypothetical protein